MKQSSSKVYHHSAAPFTLIDKLSSLVSREKDSLTNGLQLWGLIKRDVQEVS